ncbi:MAG: YdcH family protein [Alphaproteobacteria bacterium]
MSIQAHVDSLAEKRAQIKLQIAQEAHRPAPDFIMITNLKKQNLALKEEMKHYLTMLNQRQASTS